MNYKQIARLNKKQLLVHFSRFLFFVNLTQRHLRFTGGFLIEVLSLKHEPKNSVRWGKLPCEKVDGAACTVLLEKCPPDRNLLHFLELHLTFYQNMIHPDHGGGQWKTVFRILIEAETNMISLIKHDMLISLRDLSFPQKGTASLVGKPHKLVAFFFFNLPQTVSRPWTFWSSTWIDSNKVLRRNNDPIAGPCRVCLPLVKRWRVEEAVNHSKWRNLKTSGTSPRNVLKHIHPSIHPFIHPCVICFEGPNFNLHILPLMLRRGTHTHNIATVLGVYIFCLLHGKSFV